MSIVEEIYSGAAEVREPVKTRGEAPLRSWPAPLAADAIHGLAGKFVRTVEPHSEADPAAIAG